MISGDFIFGDFLEALIVKNNWLVEDLTISTLSVSQENIDSLANLINGGYIGETMSLMVSDYFYSHNRASIQYIYDELDKDDKFQLAVASVHTKIILLKTDDRHVVIHGSANMRSSACVECFTVEQDKGLYEFHKEWHDSIIEQYKTINKPIRARNPIGAK